MAYRGCAKCRKNYDSLYPCLHDIEGTRVTGSHIRLEAKQCDLENILQSRPIKNGSQTLLLQSSFRRILGYLQFR